MSPGVLPKRRFCVAPMLDHTDRHFRVLLRLLSRHAVLYTEMVTTGALIHGDVERHLGHDTDEAPVALQLGGSDPAALAHCAALGQAWGYQEINLNVGCPSNRVQAGRFGACLMAEPDRVAACVGAMVAACDLPVTVKTRIGIDHREESGFLTAFVRAVADAGAAAVIVHARKAWLTGLDPKRNRTVPPLRYERVYRLKQEFPELEVVLNGGIPGPRDGLAHLRYVDGVMLGRSIMDNPYQLADVDGLYYRANGAAPARGSVLREYLGYLRRQLGAGVPARRVIRHLTGLMHGEPGAKAWRRTLAQAVSLQEDPAGFLERAADRVFPPFVVPHEP